jgi:hypothetical protein
MNGLEHYRQAQKLLAEVETDQSLRPGPDPRVALAQVHATLALAAVTALGLKQPNTDLQQWVDEVSVVQRPKPPEDPGDPRTRLADRPPPRRPDGVPTWAAQEIPPEGQQPPGRS